MRDKKEYDYYIFIDYSENLIGYNIVSKNKVRGLLPKISKFKHYKRQRKRKLYIKHIKETIKRENIKSYFEKFKIKNVRENLDIFLEVVDFIKKHDNCIIFVSVDDYQYRIFRKMVNLADGNKTEIVKESQLKKDSAEYRLSLVIDNLLNIERRK